MVLPPCARTQDGQPCGETGDHYCLPRADHVVAFFTELLVHTKGRWAREAFRLAEWQEDEIIRPLFGEVVWQPDSARYVRRYRVAYISCGRKNGKSELLAGIALYLLVADDEEGAEVYGAAADRDQARKVFDVAMRMAQLSPTLARAINIREHAKRLVYERTASWYEIIAADAAGNLGHNPHGVMFDELLTQKDDRLFNALRTSMGTRTQPLMVIATTASDDPDAFPAQQHMEYARVAADPSRAPHIFVWIREIPTDADPWDESLWPLANPALGEFLSISALREEAIEARNDPTRENSFRQYRLNQLVQQATRWMPMHVYDECTGEPWPKPNWRRDELARRLAYGGLDLAARFDLVSWALVVPDDITDVLWRHWMPEAALKHLDLATGGAATQWVRDGWLTLTEGDVIDFQAVYDGIQKDGEDFAIREVSYDPWSGEPAVQELSRRLGRRVRFVSIPQTYVGLTPGLNDLMTLTRTKAWSHHGNPVARFCFDSVEVRRARDEPDLIRPVKPDRNTLGKRIDAVLSAAMAVGAWRRADTRKPAGGVAAF
jgi:phage terminase large subunit-like protein